MAATANVIAMQMQVMQTGGSGILVTPKNIYNAQMCYSRQSGLPHPSLYWTDPDSQESQQAAQAQAQAAKQASELEVNALKEIEKFKGDIMLAVQHMKGQQEAHTVKLQAQVDYFNAILEAKAKGKELDIQEAQLILSAAEGKTETADEASTANR